MRSIFAIILIVGFFGTSLCAKAQMTSTNYKIRWDTVGAGGDDTSSSSTYILRDTAGNAAIGNSSSASYSLRAGYRQGVYDQVIDFSFFAQDNAAIAVADSLSGTTVTVSNTTLFTSGEMVALIQDLGGTQVSAVGVITSIGSGTLTVDRWTDAGSMPTIDGTNDYVYVLSGTTAGLGTLNSSSVSTAVIGMQIHAGTDHGYVVQAIESGDLRSGSDTIDAVADGTVTAGSEEYGARSSDTSLSASTFDTQDTAFTTSFQDIVSSSSIADADRAFLTLKAAIGSGTVAGSYAQTLTLIVSGNF